MYEDTIVVLVLGVIKGVVVNGTIEQVDNGGRSLYTNAAVSYTHLTLPTILLV